jgi:hypothetical protein
VSESEDIRAVFREAFHLAETRREVWLRHLNAAIATAGARRVFTAQDSGLAETYWLLLTLLADQWMKTQDPFTLPDEAGAFSEALMTQSAFFAALKGRYTQKTAHKNLIELKHLGLIEQQGRGSGSTLHLHAQAMIAVRDTVLEWVEAHEALAQRLTGRR